MELVRSSISIVNGLPCVTVRSAPAIVVSGPAQRLLTLWPARSRSRLATLSIESSDSFVASAIVSIATGWSEPVPGRELHPLKPSAFHGALLRQLSAHHLAPRHLSGVRRLEFLRGDTVYNRAVFERVCGQACCLLGDGMKTVRFCVSGCFVLGLMCCHDAGAQARVTTVAGGYVGDGRAATTAALYEPQYAAIDSAGNVYVADYLNHRIRKVSTTGTITTVVGTGIAAFS